MNILLHAKKSLGQNFLKCGWALQAMVKAANLGDNDTIVEIGPGKGVLTASLLQKSRVVIAIEKDDRLIPYLQEKFSAEVENGKLVLVHGDILESATKIHLFSLVPENTTYKLIANIPYYITGQLLEEFLGANRQPEKMVVMLQKEVAKRIVASDGKESILSIAVKIYGTPKKIADVPRSCFAPVPNVDSAILEISNISKNNFSEVSEQKFFEVVKTGFAHKRKMLRSNLGDMYALQNIENILTSNNIDLKVRAESVAVEKWKLISLSLKNNED